MLKKIKNYIFKKPNIFEKYKENKRKILIKFSKIKKPIIFDVGFHKGETVSELKKYFKDGLFYCFEPQPEGRQYFDNLSSIEKKNVKLFNFAIGDVDTKKTFHQLNISGSSSFLKPNIQSNYFVKDVHAKKIKNLRQKKTVVEQVNGDNFCKKNNIKKIDILKIDTEGYEDKVLKGFKNFLNEGRVSIILVELNLGDNFENYNQFYDIEKYLNFNYRLISLFSDDDLNLIDTSYLKLDLIYIKRNLF